MVIKAIMLLAAATAVFAAEHQGIVKFAGLPVPGATVTATAGDKKVTVITDDRGVYTFPDLADGTWKMRVEMLCFEPSEKEIGVAANAPGPEWELKLLPFDTIKASAPPPPPSAAPSPTAGLTTSAPSTNGNANGAAPAAASTAKAKGKGKTPPAPAANTSSSFQRAEVNSAGDGARTNGDNATSAEESNKASDGLLINGSVNNGAASPFAQSAAFGNNRRNGRSLYNGSLGMILGDSVFDAKSYSLTGQDTAKPSYSRVTGLLSAGGPLRIPHLIKNGPNMVVNYQWLRSSSGDTHTGLMPTLAQRNGDFSSLLHPTDPNVPPVQIFDPTTKLPIPGNMIPASQINGQARTLLSLYPLPNFDSKQYNYQIPLLSDTHQDSLQTRGNKTIGRKDQVSAQFGMQSTRSATPNIFEFQDTNRSLGMQTSVNWTHRFTNRMFGTAGVQFSRMSARLTPYFADRVNVSGAAGIPAAGTPGVTGNNQEPANWGPPTLAFSSGISALTDAQRSVTRSQTSAVSYSLFWMHSPHSFTIGGDYRRQQVNLLSQQDPRGTLTFTGSAAGYDFAGFLLGVPDASSLAYGNADKYFREPVYDLYMSDDWRASPSLTLNLGVRWEYSAPIHEVYNRLVNLDIAPGYTVVAPVLATSPTGSLTHQQYPNSLVHPDRRAVQPRIGISWRPFLASSMVVRAGYGLYYNTSIYMPIAAQMAQQSPLSTSLTAANSPDNPLSLADPFHAAAGITANTFAVDPNLRVGYVHTFNASVQRDLPGGLVTTISYLGTKGTRSQQSYYPNTFPDGQISPAGYAFLTSNGNSIRHSGTVQLRRRLHNGLTAQVQYTFAKSIDDSALGGKGQGGSLIAQNWLDLAAERGLSTFDQRHVVNFNVQYSTGVGLGGGTLLGGWRGAIFKDWTFVSNVTAGTGLPLSPVDPRSIGKTGQTGSRRPDYTGLSINDTTDARNLNPLAVKAPVAGAWGNAGRDSITGPGQFSLNGSMARTFRMGDRVNTDVRLDATNALNHVVFPSWNTVLGNAQFGLPSTAANSMRKMQITLRVRF